MFVYILSVYSPFSDRVGLPLHNIHIPSPFTSIMDIFFVDLTVPVHRPFVIHFVGIVFLACCFVGID